MKKQNPSSMTFTKDEYGKEILLKEGDLQVMMEWEKPYMEACIDALKPSGDVLEIGFGLGYSATHIQSYKPKSHTIIECDPDVIKKAKSWAKKYPHVTIVEGMWQDKLAELGKYDVIFFDDYSPFTKEQVAEIQSSSTKMQQLVEHASSLMDAIQENLKRFKGIQFSDSELRDFGHDMLNRKDVSSQDVLGFIDTLIEGENITPKQKTMFLKEFEKKLKANEKPSTKQTLSFEQEAPADRFIHFVTQCLDYHMHSGAKLSAFMESSKSKKKHPEFVKHILSRDDVKYSEKTIPIDVPDNCKYYTDNKALVIVIQKQ